MLQLRNVKDHLDAALKIDGGGNRLASRNWGFPGLSC
jgi:hypothetical protein